MSSLHYRSDYVFVTISVEYARCSVCDESPWLLHKLLGHRIPSKRDIIILIKLSVINGCVKVFRCYGVPLIMTELSTSNKIVDRMLLLQMVVHSLFLCSCLLCHVVHVMQNPVAIR